MTIFTTSDGISALSPDDLLELIIRPLEREAVAFDEAIATKITTGSTKVRVPILTMDGGAAWVAEGDEISIADTEFDELEIIPKKVAGLRIISREAANDTSPAGQEAVGGDLVRSIAAQVDSAFFGNLAAPAPKGLGNVSAHADTPTVVHGYQSSYTGATVTNLDAFAEAISLASNAGANITGFAANPADALVLAKLKTGTTSAQPLLETDATKPTRRMIQGVPLLVSRHVTPGAIWGLDASQVYTVLREDVDIQISDQAYFSSDRIGIRGTARIAFGYTNPDGLVKVELKAKP